MQEENSSGIQMYSPEEVALVEEISVQFPDELAENSRLVKFMAACCLRNRNYDLKSALKRLGNYLDWRKDIFGHIKDQSVDSNEILQNQIKAGALFMCPCRLPDGAAALCIRMKHHNPSEFCSHKTLQYWHYTIMTALAKEPSLAMTGFVFINNFEGASLANSDLSVPAAVSKALNKCMPIRVRSINLVSPPWVLRFIIPIIKTILPAKLAGRMKIIADPAELPEKLSVSCQDLPVEFGGQVEVLTPESLLEQMVLENIFV